MQDIGNSAASGQFRILLTVQPVANAGYFQQCSQWPIQDIASSAASRQFGILLAVQPVANFREPVKLVQYTNIPNTLTLTNNPERKQ